MLDKMHIVLYVYQHRIVKQFDVNGRMALKRNCERNRRMDMNAEHQETLVVVSKMKAYIREKSGMNTAGNVADTVSDIVRRECDRAIEQARKAGRKTVMDRDFAAPTCGCE